VANTRPENQLADRELMSTRECADFLGMSTQWLDAARNNGWGPKFTKLSPRATRYRRSDVMEWLRKRDDQATRKHVRKARTGRAA
jgi:predicted DNA-binding transcriptional regulator AlpA